jgi:ABC-2 type transport system ATP-binding protein
VTLPDLPSGVHEVVVEFPRMPLAESIYQCSVAIADTGNRTVFHRINRVVTFRVVTDVVEDGAVHLQPEFRVGPPGTLADAGRAGAVSSKA